MYFVHIHVFMLWLSLAFAFSQSETPIATEPELQSQNLVKRGQDGRYCDFSAGYYVPWSDCGNAIRAWCYGHQGQSVSKGSSIDSSPVQGFKSGKWNVQFYVKYQNDHIPSWDIDYDACVWYLSYIAQGCTKGGNKPSDTSKQVSDGGTFYEPTMGSIDFEWQYVK